MTSFDKTKEIGKHDIAKKHTTIVPIHVIKCDGAFGLIISLLF